MVGRARFERATIALKVRFYKITSTGTTPIEIIKSISYSINAALNTYHLLPLFIINWDKNGTKNYNKTL